MKIKLNSTLDNNQMIITNLFLKEILNLSQ